MTQSNDPNEYERGLDRRYRNLNRRLERLEDTQVTAQEFTRAFDRVYEEMGIISSEIKAVNARLDSLEAKFDIVMQYITGR